MAELISDKIDFKSETVRQRIYNEKSISSPRRQNIYKHLYTKHQSSKIYEANSDRIEDRGSSTRIVGSFSTSISIMS